MKRSGRVRHNIPNMPIDSSPEPMVVKAIFERALDLQPTERDAFLNKECSGQADLRKKVERLLELSEKSRLRLDQVPDLVASMAGNWQLGDLKSGRILGERFRIIRMLGEGGMGSVYEAEDMELGNTKVALKTIRADLADQPGLMDRFKKEIQLLRRITHPNVCRVFDFFPGRDDEPSFFTMELLEGESLRERLKREGELTPQTARPIAIQVMHGLEAAHAMGVIHRDLKPSNIMLVPAIGETRVVLMDFGVARGSSSETGVDTGLTESGMAVGTPTYMAPEQIQGKPVTASTDIYAFGVVMYEALTAIVPYDGKTPLAMVARKLETKPTAPRVLKPSLDSQWNGLILRCLEKEPEDRFRSAAEVRRILEHPTRIDAIRLRMGNLRQTTKLELRIVALSIGLMVLMGAGYQWWVSRPYVARPAARTWYERGLRAMVDGATLTAYQQLGLAMKEDPAYPAAAAARVIAAQELDLMSVSQETLLRFPSKELHGTDALRMDAAREMTVWDASAVKLYEKLASKSEGVEQLFAHVAAASIAERLGRLKEAAEIYEKVLEKDPNQAGVLLRLGQLQKKMGQPKKSLETLGQALRVQQVSNDVEGQARTSLAMVLVKDSGMQQPIAKSKDELRAVADMLRTLHTPLQLEIETRLHFAEFLIVEGKAEEAKSQILSASDLARGGGPEAEGLAARSMNDLAFSLSTQHKYREAEQYAREALNYSRRSGSRSNEAKAQRLLAQSLVWLRRLDEVESPLNAAEGFYREHNFAAERLRTGLTRLDWMIEQKNEKDPELEAVLSLAQNLTKQAQEAESRDLQAAIATRIAHVYRVRGDEPKVMEMYVRSAGQLGELGQYQEAARRLFSAAEGEALMGLTKNAAKNVSRGEEFLRNIDGGTSRMRFSAAIAKMEIAVGERNWREAELRANDALAFGPETAGAVQHSTVVFTHCLALIRLGKPEGFTECKTEFDARMSEAKSYRQSRAAEWWIHSLYAAGKYREAVEAGERLLPMIRSLGRVESLATSEWFLAQAYKKLGMSAKWTEWARAASADFDQWTKYWPEPQRNEYLKRREQ